MGLSKILKTRRKELGLTLLEIANRIGVTEATVQRWESGEIKTLRQGRICKLAGIVEVSPAQLMEWDDYSSEKHSSQNSIHPGVEPIPKMQKVPLVGHIACGQPITAEENLEGYVDAPAEKQIDFALTCHGDSMIDAGIHDGDTVYIRKQEEVENGQIAAIRIDDEATLKRVYYYPEDIKIVLQPANVAYAPQVYVGEELDGISIEGLLIGFTHWMEK